MRKVWHKHWMKKSPCHVPVHPCNHTEKLEEWDGSKRLGHDMKVVEIGKRRDSTKGSKPQPGISQPGFRTFKPRLKQRLQIDGRQQVATVGCSPDGENTWSCASLCDLRGDRRGGIAEVGSLANKKSKQSTLQLLDLFEKAISRERLQ